MVQAALVFPIDEEFVHVFYVVFLFLSGYKYCGSAEVAILRFSEVGLEFVRGFFSLRGMLAITLNIILSISHKQISFDTNQRKNANR